jgi:MoxR-like ATPase
LEGPPGTAKTTFARIAAEIPRILRPGGLAGITDVTVTDAGLPAELTTLTAWVACIAGAGLHPASTAPTAWPAVTAGSAAWPVTPIRPLWRLTYTVTTSCLNAV